MDHPDDPAAATTMVPTSPQDLVQHLRGYEGRSRRPCAPRRGRHPILPALIALVEDALTDDQRDLGWAPLHAIDLLGALEDARALPVLLRCLDLEDELDLRVEQAEAALRALGARALEGCVAAYAASPRDAVRDRLAGVMSRGASTTSAFMPPCWTRSSGPRSSGRIIWSTTAIPARWRC